MAGDVYDLSAHTYEDALKLCELVYDDPNASAEIDRLMTKWGRNKDWDTVISDWVNTPTQQEFQTSLNKYRRYAGNGYVSPIKNQKGNTIAYETTQEASLTESLNSNSSPRATVKTPMQTNYEIVDNVPRTTFKTGVRETGKFVFGNLLPAVAGVSTGISLGKKISQYAYDQGWSWGTNIAELDRDLYESMTCLDPLDRAVFKTLWGIDESTGTATAYLDEDAYAYLAMVMATQRVFANEWTAPTEADGISVTGVTNGIYFGKSQGEVFYPYGGTQRRGFVADRPVIWYLTVNRDNRDRTGLHLVFTEIGTKYSFFTLNNPDDPIPAPAETVSSLSQNINGVQFGWAGSSYSLVSNWNPLPAMTFISVDNTTNVRNMEYLMIAHGDSSGVPGFENQSGATLPTGTEDWTTLPATKQSLQQQYPDLYNNAKHYDYTDDDGNNRTKTYLPIPLPDNFSNTGNTPTSGDSTQDRTGNTIISIPDSLIDTITKIINNQPSPNTPSDGTPTNQPPTGSGESPTVVTPVGSASSLWKIYNPSQAQLDSFGSWLWSSDFVDQIKKLFNDPMQGIIGVHKVFASPDIGGSATIKVGYLDSGVSSNWVSDQYTTVNCGTVSLREYFGNVFDYAPYTKVSLYLPFIGIVDLDVGDVMRASINVKYHVDVLTGACLADVKVDRDGCEAVLYQYSGSAIVTYPVSSGNYMGMVAGVLSVASGVAGTILSGGALAPALIGGAVGASHLHTDVSHSGGFSGCAGAMASKKPYLIISRPQTALADNFKHFTGFPANSHVTLNNCSGYTKVKSIYVGSMQIATDEEKDMIEAQLKAGVLI